MGRILRSRRRHKYEPTLREKMTDAIFGHTLHRVSFKAVCVIILVCIVLALLGMSALSSETAHNALNFFAKALRYWFSIP